MLHNYQEEMNIGLTEMKDYLLAIGDDDQVEKCFMTEQLLEFVNKHYNDYLYKGMLALIEAKGFDEMERQLIMMNYFFGEDKLFIRMKRKIKKIMLDLNKPLRVYQILRHIMNLDCLTLIETLHQNGYMNLSQCAYCCLVEGDAEEAYKYLSGMTSRPSTALLDYYHSYSASGYYSLLRLYRRRQPVLAFS